MQPVTKRYMALLSIVSIPVGMALMMVSTLHLSSADPKANWLEQEGSGAAQPCFFLGLTLLP